MHIPPWRRPPEPPHPPRCSRSPVARRTQGLIEAHRRNVGQRRGGKAARRRTKSIHRRLLEILVTRLSQLLSIIVQGRSLYERRLQQVQGRLNWLGDPANFPADKALVLPGARAEIEDILVEPESVLETVYLESSGEEDVEYIEDPDRPYGDNEQLNRVFRRLRDQGQLEEASSSSRPSVLPSSSSRPPVLPSSSSRPLVLQQRPKPRPAAPPTRPIIRTLASFDLRRLELQIQEGSGPIEGAKAIISYDHHNVLDSCRLSLPQRMQLGSRHATGEKGKLSVLRASVRLATPLFHIDHSAEVIEEFRQVLSVTPSCVWTTRKSKKCTIVQSSFDSSV